MSTIAYWTSTFLRENLEHSGPERWPRLFWQLLEVRIPLTGLEPVVSALRGRRVNHLHYSGKYQRSSFSIHSLFHRRNESLAYSQMLSGAAVLSGGQALRHEATKLDQLAAA